MHWKCVQIAEYIIDSYYFNLFYVNFELFQYNVVYLPHRI